MPKFLDLSDADRDRIMRTVDHVHRPLVANMAKLFSQLEVALEGFLASSTGQPSTSDAPAADSILGILQSLDSGQVIPKLDTGMDGAQDLLKDILVSSILDISNLLKDHNTVPSRHIFALICGTPNIG